MCKVIMITNTSKILEPLVFADKMREILADQRDGFGMAILNSDNTVYGLRTLKPAMNLAVGPKFPWCEEHPTETFGELKAVTKAAIYHGRISTNNVSLLNTHPISKNGWHLIHNGVVQDKQQGADAKPRMTSNDSEYVLDHLMTGGVEACAEHLTGYYAVGAFDPSGALHIFKDKTASLRCAYSELLKSYIFATNANIMNEIGKYIGETLWDSQVSDDTYVKFVDGAPVEQKAFTSRGYSWDESKWASKSLGRELPATSVSESVAGPDDKWLDKWTRNAQNLQSNLTKADKRNMYLLDALCDDFLDLLDYEAIDDSYSIYTKSGKRITAAEFYNMKLVNQVGCEIKDRDGRQVPKFRKVVKKQKGTVTSLPEA